MHSRLIMGKLALALLTLLVLLACGGGGTTTVLPTATVGLTPTAFPTVAPTATPAPALLQVASSPSGATVEVGLQPVGGVYMAGTGRVVGLTPLTVALQVSDVSIVGGVASIVFDVPNTGYRPSDTLIGLSMGGVRCRA